MPNLIKWALYYHSLGLCPLPLIPETKKPYVEWKQFQQEPCTEDNIKGWWGKYPSANVGLVTGKRYGFTVIDIDSEEALRQCKELIPDSLHFPIAKSPRGGQHWYFAYHPEVITKADYIPDLDARNDGGYISVPPSCNGMPQPYVWMTEILKIDKLPEIPQEFFEKLLKPKLIAKEGTNFIPVGINLEPGSRNQTIFHIANCLAKGGMPQEEIETTLVALARAHGIVDKETIASINSAVDRKTVTDKAIIGQIRDFIQTTSAGTFRVQDVERYVTPVADANGKIKPVSNKTILMSLNRMVKKGLIEKLPLPSAYRIVKIDTDRYHISQVGSCEWYDNLILPFGLQNFVRLAPGNLVALAGVSNAGKSAIILNMIKDNMEHHKCIYFSSEMSKELVKERTGMYREKLNWDFEIVENWDQNPDQIQPGYLNFIDWVEAGDEPFKVATLLSRIQNKLKNKGLAVVALQKNSDKPFAVGGEQTRSKTALYINIDEDFPGQTMTIKKAKAFGEVNPNNFTVKFKIVKGINLLRVGDGWRPSQGVKDKY